MTLELDGNLQYNHTGNQCLTYIAGHCDSLWCNLFDADDWLKEMPLLHSKQRVKDERLIALEMEQ